MVILEDIHTDNLFANFLCLSDEVSQALLVEWMAYLLFFALSLKIVFCHAPEPDQSQ